MKLQKKRADGGFNDFLCMTFHIDYNEKDNEYLLNILGDIRAEEILKRRIVRNEIVGYENKKDLVISMGLNKEILEPIVLRYLIHKMTPEDPNDPQTQKLSQIYTEGLVRFSKNKNIFFEFEDEKERQAKIHTVINQKVSEHNRILSSDRPLLKQKRRAEED